MSATVAGGVDSAAATASAVTSSSTKTTAKASGELSFDEIFKLALMPGESGDVSAHAKSLMQEKGFASALALLGN